MGIHKFVIVLDQPSGIYYAGSKITGKVLLWLNKTKKFRGIKIKFKGKAYVSWQRSENVYQKNGRTESRIIHYSGKELFLNNEYYLDGCDTSKITIAAGYQHDYPFNVDIPFNIPSSFEGKHGYIRYEITATLVRPWMFDLKEKKGFTVITPFDLNGCPSAMLPINVKEQKTFFTFRNSTNETLEVSVSLPQSGYVVGQDIPINLTATNASNFTVDSLEVKIIKKEYWKVQYPRHDTKTYVTEVVKKNFKGVEARNSVSFMDIINLTNTVFVNLEGCTIFNMSFFIEVKACVRSFFRKGLTVKVPLTIGTIPIQNQRYEQNFPTSAGIMNFNQGQMYSNTPTVSLHPDIEPPPYSVAILMPPPQCAERFYNHGQSQFYNTLSTPSPIGLHPSAPPPDEK